MILLVLVGNVGGLLICAILRGVGTVLGRLSYGLLKQALVLLLELFKFGKEHVLHLLHLSLQLHLHVMHTIKCLRVLVAQASHALASVHTRMFHVLI